MESVTIFVALFCCDDVEICNLSVSVRRGPSDRERLLRSRDRTSSDRPRSDEFGITRAPLRSDGDRRTVNSFAHRATLFNTISRPAPCGKIRLRYFFYPYRSQHCYQLSAMISSMIVNMQNNLV